MKNNFVFPVIICFVIVACNSIQESAVSSDQAIIIEFPSPSSESSSLPHLTVGDNDLLYLSWVTQSDQTAKFWYAQFDKSTKGWNSPILIAEGTDWFVNWADYPQLTIDEKGKKVAHFLQKSGIDTYAYDVMITYENSDSTWSQPIRLHDDSTQTEHGFVTTMPYQNKFLSVWLDGRHTLDHHNMESDTSQTHVSDTLLHAMNLRSAFIDLQGAIQADTLIDPTVCDCCQTDMALSSNGPVVVYRNRTVNEIRDIYLTRWNNNRWSTPIPVYNDQWEIAGCPVNGPRVDALDNHLAVVWFSGARNVPRVKLIFSHNGGKTFGSPVLIEEKNPLGRVGIAMEDKDHAMVSWLSRSDSVSKIVCARVHENYGVLDQWVVSETDPSRSSGFPQMVRWQGETYFAWTASLNPSEIKMAKLSLPNN